jgi:hypothetical protein
MITGVDKEASTNTGQDSHSIISTAAAVSSTPSATTANTTTANRHHTSQAHLLSVAPLPALLTPQTLSLTLQFQQRVLALCMT